MTARGREKVFGSSMQTFSRLDATEMASKLSAGGGSLFIPRAGMSAHGRKADIGLIRYAQAVQDEHYRFNNDKPLHDRFVRDILQNRYNKAILDRWSSLALPNAWLVAGCLFQTVWNLRSGAAAEAQIKDYDLFFFDAADVSEGTERRTQGEVNEALSDLGVTVEATNQARVHLWYRDHFGYPYPQLASACEGIDRFLVPATCVGVRPSARGWEVYAPHGLQLLYDGVLTPNPLTDHRALFQEKASSYQTRWPWLKIETPTF